MTGDRIWCIPNNYLVLVEKRGEEAEEGEGGEHRHRVGAEGIGPR
jgi:hypothetical protein